MRIISALIVVAVLGGCFSYTPPKCYEPLAPYKQSYCGDVRDDRDGGDREKPSVEVAPEPEPTPEPEPEPESDQELN